MECKNCTNELTIEDKFCNKCGAKVIDQIITYSYVANDFTERFLNVENNLILRTLKDLFLRPELVINGYIRGVRKKHLNVANLLALALTLSGLQIYLIKKFFQDNVDMSWMLPANNPFAAQNDNSFLDALFEYQGIMYLVLIPIYALISRLVFINSKKYTNLHHIIINAYTQGFLSIIFFIPTILALYLGVNFFKITYFVIFPAMIVYSAYVFKILYNLSMVKIILKTLFFFLVTFVLYIVFTLGIFALLLVFGDLNLEDFAPKKEAVDAVSYIASSVINWTS